MVSDLADYMWSSYRANGLGIASGLCSPHEQYLALGRTQQERLANYRSLFESQVDGDLLTEVRHAVNKGLVLGTNKFRREIETITGQRLSHLKPGRKVADRRQPDEGTGILL